MATMIRTEGGSATTTEKIAMMDSVERSIVRQLLLELSFVPSSFEERMNEHSQH